MNQSPTVEVDSSASAIVNPKANDNLVIVGGLACKGDRHSEVEPFRGTLLPSHHLTASHSVGCFSPPKTTASPSPTANAANHNNNNENIDDDAKVNGETNNDTTQKQQQHHRINQIRHHHRGAASSAQDLSSTTNAASSSLSASASCSNGVVEGIQLSAKLRESMFTVKEETSRKI